MRPTNAPRIKTEIGPAVTVPAAGGKAAIAFVLLFLAACAPHHVEPSGPPVDPTIEGLSFVSGDGHTAPVRVWRPTGPPRAIIVGVHGFNDYGNAFDAPATWWAERGMQTYAFDQRGFGGSNVAGAWPGSGRLVADLCAFTAIVRSRHPELPFYILGVSMGGAVALLAEGDGRCLEPSDASGLILVAPAVWGRSTINPIARATLWLAAHVVPAFPVNGDGLGITPSDNKEMLRQLSADPMVIKNTRVDAVYGIVNLMDDALQAAPGVQIPALVLYGARDEIIPAEPTRLMIGGWTGPLRFAYYPDGYHMLLRDLSAETVWRDILSWIEDSAAPLPSGRDAQAVQAFVSP